MGRIAIVGAGIGGLCAGRAVALAGHEPVVLERSEADTAPGATPAEIDAESLGDAAGAPLLLIERAILHRILGRDLAVRTGAHVAEVGDGELILTDGERVKADAIVGADGIGSTVRAAIAPDSMITDSGHTVIRGIADHDLGDGTAFEIWGSGELVGGAALPNGRTYWFYEAPTRRLDGRAPLDAMDVARWPGPVPAVVGSTDPSALLVNRVRTITPPRTWTRGTTAPLGDAAHAMAPNLGQGAAQAIEDATALLRVLKQEPSLARALAAYEKARRPRARRIQAESGRAARFALTRHSLPRDLLMRAVPDALGTRAIQRRLGL